VCEGSGTETELRGKKGKQDKIEGREEENKSTKMGLRSTFKHTILFIYFSFLSLI